MSTNRNDFSETNLTVASNFTNSTYIYKASINVLYVSERKCNGSNLQIRSQQTCHTCVIIRVHTTLSLQKIITFYDYFS